MSEQGHHVDVQGDGRRTETLAKVHGKTKGEISYGRTNKRTKKKGCTQNQTSTDAETETESSGTGGAGDQYAFADPKELRTLWEAPEPQDRKSVV